MRPPQTMPQAHYQGEDEMYVQWPERSQAQTSMHPAVFFLRTSPWPMATQFIIQFYWSSELKNMLKNSGVSWSRDLIQLSSAKSKDQLSMAQISRSPPQNLLSHSQKKKKKPVQTSGTISLSAEAAMMSTFWLQTAYLCFNSCQEQQISGF